MIAGHIDFGRTFDHYIHAYHIPLFFFISGYLYKKPYSIGELIKKRARTLLVPYLSFGLIYWAGDCVFTKHSFNVDTLVRLLTFNHKGLAIAGALWFLTSAFISSILYCIIREKFKSKISCVLAVCLIPLCGIYFPKAVNFRLPWCADTALVGVGLMGAGNALKNKLDSEYIIEKNTVLGIMILVNIAMIFTNGMINMRKAQYANVPVFWINAILAIVILFEISKRINKQTHRFGKYIANELRFIGRNTVVYLCMNQLLILWINGLCDYMGIQSMRIEGAYKLVMLVMLLVLLHFITKLFNQTRLKILIGK